jgi:hypothetical protein
MGFYFINRKKEKLFKNCFVKHVGFPGKQSSALALCQAFEVNRSKLGSV